MKRTHNEQIRRDNIEGQTLRRQFKDLLQKLKKSHLDEMEVQTNWTMSLVDLVNKTFFQVMKKMRDMFDERVRQIDFYTEVAKEATEETDYFMNVGIFRM
jgi:polysaccharide pyruvyl transferase WcaK-like protein